MREGSDYLDLVTEILEILPNAEFSEDRYGQIVFHSGWYATGDGGIRNTAPEEFVREIEHNVFAIKKAPSLRRPEERRGNATY
jgi:hypothetical protein